MQNLALIKLGGSVITFKDEALTANMYAIDGISRELVQLDIPLIVVHGGGSYGHYWSVKYDMHTRPAAYNQHGISIVHASMVYLNNILINSMIKAGSNPYTIQPSMFTSRQKPIIAKIKEVYVMAKSKMIPVTFGDAVYMGGKKFSIFSGDALMSMLAKALRPSKVIFATNVDGIYRDMETRDLIRELHAKKDSSIEFSYTPNVDVTGGINRKVREAFKIASLGIDVMLLNGLIPERISQAVSGRLETGTFIRGMK